MNITQIYLAGPLFTAAEISFNLKLYYDLVSKGYKVFLPQTECAGKTLEDIYLTCRNGIDSSSVVLAILDGADADSGTCWECGYATAKGIPVIGLRTDFRKSGDTGGFNAMIFYSAIKVIDGEKDYFNKVLDSLEYVKKNIKEPSPQLVQH
jgi:nucleoside 2-deoxyribosyltransferase